MLLTSRPDLLPIDLKRQGRAEVHIPLFYPYEEAEIRQMFEVMARKNKLTLAADALPKVSTDRHLSGADIESVVLAAKRAALGAGRAELTRGRSGSGAWASSFPPRRAWRRNSRRRPRCWNARKCSLLPPAWRQKVSEPDGRSRLQERVAAIGNCWRIRILVGLAALDPPTTFKLLLMLLLSTLSQMRNALL